MIKKSAKDIAFEKERTAFRKRIRELEDQLRLKDMELAAARQETQDATSHAETLEHWVERLLTYTEMSKDDMKKLIEKDIHESEVMKHMAFLFNSPIFKIL